MAYGKKGIQQTYKRTTVGTVVCAGLREQILQVLLQDAEDRKYIDNAVTSNKLYNANHGIIACLSHRTYRFATERIENYKTRKKINVNFISQGLTTFHTE